MAFTSKFVFTVVNVLMLILVPIHQIEGFPNGAPITACGSMTPSHGVVGQQSPSPFVTVVSDKVISFIESLFFDKIRDPMHIFKLTILFGDGYD